jgi:hypothetical protein
MARLLAEARLPLTFHRGTVPHVKNLCPKTPRVAGGRSLGPMFGATVGVAARVRRLAADTTSDDRLRVGAVSVAAARAVDPADRF